MSARFFSLALLVILAGCEFFAPKDRFVAREVPYSALSSWEQDDHAEALHAFLKSCSILANKARGASSGSGLQVPEPVWRSLCEDSSRVWMHGHYPEARLFFERRFVPYRVSNNNREQGLFTGYYEPVLYGSWRRYGDFQYPVYLVPPELAKSKPYLTRAEIDSGGLEGRKLEILWVDDPVMLFFLHIQGSGRVKLISGKQLYIGYADQNGHKYVGLGKIMGDEGMLPKDQINFFTIRQWLYQNREQAFDLMYRNPSYIFFKLRDKPGAIGAVGAVLTPQRSLAVDSSYIPYGLPLFLEVDLPAQPGQAPAPFRRTMMAQDTGGAIKGPVRGDIFFGAGDEAEFYAGYMKNRGIYTLLVPREVAYQLR